MLTYIFYELNFSEYIQPRAVLFNFEAELALLGAILLNNRAMERVIKFLRPEHFADPVHGLIFDAPAQLIGQRRRIGTRAIFPASPQDFAIWTRC